MLAFSTAIRWEGGGGVWHYLEVDRIYQKAGFWKRKKCHAFKQQVVAFTDRLFVFRFQVVGSTTFGGSSCKTKGNSLTGEFAGSSVYSVQIRGIYTASKYAVYAVNLDGVYTSIHGQIRGQYCSEIQQRISLANTPVLLHTTDFHHCVQQQWLVNYPLCSLFCHVDFQHGDKNVCQPTIQAHSLNLQRVFRSEDPIMLESIESKSMET